MIQNWKYRLTAPKPPLRTNFSERLLYTYFLRNFTKNLFFSFVFIKKLLLVKIIVWSDHFFSDNEPFILCWIPASESLKLGPSGPSRYTSTAVYHSLVYHFYPHPDSTTYAILNIPQHWYTATGYKKFSSEVFPFFQIPYGVWPTL